MTDDEKGEPNTLEDAVRRITKRGMVAGAVAGSLMSFVFTVDPESASPGGGISIIIAVASMLVIMTWVRSYTHGEADYIRQNVDLEREAQAGNVEEIADQYAAGEIEECEMERRLDEKIVDTEDREKARVVEQ
jgi:uncharacterized membrane protein